MRFRMHDIIGTALVLQGMIVLFILPFSSSYQLRDSQVIKSLMEWDGERWTDEVLTAMETPLDSSGLRYRQGKMAFQESITQFVDGLNQEVVSAYGVSPQMEAGIKELGQVDSASIYAMLATMSSSLSPSDLAPLIGKQGVEKEEALRGLKKDLNDRAIQLKGIPDHEVSRLRVHWTDIGSDGISKRRPLLCLLLSIGLLVVGGLVIIIPSAFRGMPGIRHNGVSHNPWISRRFWGVVLGVVLILFMVVVYWFPSLVVEWIQMLHPFSMAIKHSPADQWMFYGLMYTLAMMVMAVRMVGKYRHVRYQRIRTYSVLFFQLVFALLLPEILLRLNQPYFDFKNIWPLDHDLLYNGVMVDYAHQEGGQWLAASVRGGRTGQLMLAWGILLTTVAVPVLTYFLGKRWYCSWVCGCGGLAETAGDPFRQLSNKGLKAWKVERWMVHGVLLVAVLMTVLTVITLFTGQWMILGIPTYLVQRAYGFLIASVFAGVIGVGFYPFMGSRVWCRFGCPLAAYLGLVQRFKSRFRITTNGGQCISCGNCSTYCEMGIDVRSYAQRGKSIVRASCVGCGVCAAVCPRGVLKLENGPAEDRVEDNPLLVGEDAIHLKK